MRLRGILLACMLMIVFIPAARIASAGTDLYGVEFNDSELYLVDEATGAATLIGPCEAKNGLSTHESRLFGWDGGREILEIDPTTGATLHSWPVKGDIVGAEGGFAIDRSGVAYFTGRYSYDEFLARIDLNDAGGYTAETVVRDLDILMDGLAFNSSGVLYGLSQGTLDLYTISTSDGSLTRVGNVGVYTEDTAGIAFGDDGTLYALFGKDLYTIDSSTGAATLVGPTGHGARFGGLAALSPLEAVFSLDVGSDMELSDRATADKGEDLDPGDLYRAFGAAGTLHDPPVVDDAALFSKDPPPIQGDPSTALLPGSGFSAAEAFDLDGCDRLRDPLDFLGKEGEPLARPHLQNPDDPDPDPNVRELDTILISFQDDNDLNSWQVSRPTGQLPTDSKPDFGWNGNRTELFRLTKTSSAWKIQRYASEKTVHPDLESSISTPRLDDDDVDALDSAAEDAGFLYISSDDEARGGLNPGSIYEIDATGGKIQRVSPAMLGLTSDADVDAFEFAWIPVPAGKHYGGLTGKLAFAVLFSTGEDKPTRCKCSGGIDPNSLHYSFFDGRNYKLISSAYWHQWNIDAITVLWDLGSPPADETERALRAQMPSEPDRAVLPDGRLAPGGDRN